MNEVSSLTQALPESVNERRESEEGAEEVAGDEDEDGDVGKW